MSESPKLKYALLKEFSGNIFFFKANQNCLINLQREILVQLKTKKKKPSLTLTKAETKPFFNLMISTLYVSLFFYIFNTLFKVY